MYTQYFLILLMTKADIGFSKLNGKMSKEERDIEINSFRNNESSAVMLLTKGVGGVGLNLSHACILLNLDFNYSHGIDAQCFSRIIRMNQDKIVYVISPVVFGRMDHRVKQVCVYHK